MAHRKEFHENSRRVAFRFRFLPLLCSRAYKSAPTCLYNQRPPFRSSASRANVPSEREPPGSCKAIFGRPLVALINDRAPFRAPVLAALPQRRSWRQCAAASLAQQRAAHGRDQPAKSRSNASSSRQQRAASRVSVPRAPCARRRPTCRRRSTRSAHTRQHQRSCRSEASSRPTSVPGGPRAAERTREHRIGRREPGQRSREKEVRRLGAATSEGQRNETAGRLTSKKVK